MSSNEKNLRNKKIKIIYGFEENFFFCLEFGQDLLKLGVEGGVGAGIGGHFRCPNKQA